ncbi:unnamed protein product [Dovyalis caffra]|uniref:Uncharacterized protein n=1 Tax=Dovyalis caffra TaxID=77055 RepID=A0AAV1RE89_9ROSI|nr:unnamed protein product [Dovyalis caffra]
MNIFLYSLMLLTLIRETYSSCNSMLEPDFYKIDSSEHREDVQKALVFAEYIKAQRTAAAKVDQMCKGVEKGQSFSSDFNVESGELAPMFFPGPFAIAHHLITSWVNQGSTFDAVQLKQEPSSSLSNL